MSKPRKRRKSRARDPDGPPKGSYPHPEGGYCTEHGGPSRKSRKYRRGRRDVVVVARRRVNPDLKALAKVLIGIAAEQNAEKRRKLEDAES